MKYQAPHEEWLEKILAKLSGELSPADLAALNNHLASCSACSEAMYEYELLAAHADTASSNQQGSQLPPRMLALKREIQQSMQKEGEKLLAASSRVKEQTLVEKTTSGSQTPPIIPNTRYRRGPEPGSQKAKRGGQTVREKYGPEFYSRIGKKGGQTIKEKRGPQFYAEIGKKGGDTVKRQQGSEFYSRIGKKGGERRRASKHEESTQESIIGKTEKEKE